MGDITDQRVRLFRVLAITLVVCFVDAVAGSLVSRPMPWVAIIPTSIPLLIVALIILPMQRAGKK